VHFTDLETWNIKFHHDEGKLHFSRLQEMQGCARSVVPLRGCLFLRLRYKNACLP
jgi:hypothetical protein